MLKSRKPFRSRPTAAVPGAATSNVGKEFDETELLRRYAAIRRRILKEFNLRLEDFNYDQRRYDDYLEKVEELIDKLCNGADEEMCQELIKQNRITNQELIRINQGKKAEEERLVAEKLAAEEREHRFRLEELRRHDAALEEEKRLEKLRKEQDVLDQIEGKPGAGKKELAKKKVVVVPEKNLQPQPPAISQPMVPVMAYPLPTIVSTSTVPDKDEKDSKIAEHASGFDRSIVERRIMQELMESLQL